MLFRKNKGQISLFIIIGVIIVIGVLFLILFNSKEIPVFTDQKTTYNVKNYVESCLLEESTNAVNLVGVSGGWLYHKPMTFTDRNNPKELNKMAKGLNFLERTEIPYWAYFDDTKNEFKLNIPEYDTEDQYSIKNQIKKYIDENLENNCIQSFRTFKGIYDVNYEPREINTIVEMKEKEIVVTLDLPLEITDEVTGGSETIEFFKQSINNEIYVPYHIAKDITYSQVNSSFIEKRMMQFLRPYQSSKGRDLLPPQYKYELVYDFKPWKVSDVEELVKLVLNSEIGNIKFLNTNYENENLEFELQDNEFAKNFVNLYTVDYLSENSLVKKNNKKLFERYKDYDIKPTYEPFFPMYFSIENSIADVILLPKPQAFLGIIPIFFTEYIASYEITAPIVFEIKNNNNFNNFIFNLAIESNIKHNVPLKDNIDYKLNLDDESNILGSQHLICDPTQFVSGLVSINITDPIDYGKREFLGPKVGVQDAIVSFDCKGITTCFITQTDINSENNGGTYSSLNFRLPLNCGPGKIELFKFGHSSVVIDNINPTLDDKINLGTIEMPSSKKVSVRVSLADPGSSKFSIGRTLSESENGYLIFENKETPEFVRVIDITADNQYNLSIDLLPGNYSIQGFVLYNDSLTIASKEICYNKNLFQTDCTTIPVMDLDSWIVGGLEIENFEVSTKDLLLSEKMIVNFVDYGVPFTYDDLEKVSSKMADLKLNSLEPYLE